MHLKDIIKLYTAILLPSLVYNIVHTKHKNIYSTDRSKRFTLQDLFSGGLQPGVTTPAIDPSASNEGIQTVDVQSLLNAIQTNQNKPVAQNFRKPIDIDVEADKNGNYNVPDLSNFLNRNTDTQEAKTNALDLNDLAGLVTKQQINNDPNVVRQDFNLGKEKIEIEAAGKRATHYSLVKGVDGQFNLVPVVDGAAQTNGNKFEVLQPKAGFEEKGQGRQQMQLTTLVRRRFICIFSASQSRVQVVKCFSGQKKLIF